MKEPSWSSYPPTSLIQTAKQFFLPVGIQEGLTHLNSALRGGEPITALLQGLTALSVKIYYF